MTSHQEVQELLLSSFLCAPGGCAAQLRIGPAWPLLSWHCSSHPVWSVQGREERDLVEPRRGPEPAAWQGGHPGGEASVLGARGPSECAMVGGEHSRQKEPHVQRPGARATQVPTGLKGPLGLEFRTPEEGGTCGWVRKAAVPPETEVCVLGRGSPRVCPLHGQCLRLWQTPRRLKSLSSLVAVRPLLTHLWGWELTTPRWLRKPLGGSWPKVPRGQGLHTPGPCPVLPSQLPPADGVREGFRVRGSGGNSGVACRFCLGLHVS